LRASPWPAQI